MEQLQASLFRFHGGNSFKFPSRFTHTWEKGGTCEGGAKPVQIAPKLDFFFLVNLQYDLSHYTNGLEENFKAGNIII